MIGNLSRYFPKNTNKIIKMSMSGMLYLYNTCLESFLLYVK